MVLICVFLMTNNIEHFFISLQFLLTILIVSCPPLPLLKLGCLSSCAFFTHSGYKFILFLNGVFDEQKFSF